MRRDGWQAIAGILGPGAFVTAWAALGTGRPGYSPVNDPISRLAAVGASSRPMMTAGLVAFAAGVGAYAPVLGRMLPGGAGTAAAATAAATLGIAALPLEGVGGDSAHAIAAGIAYASLAAVPYLGARALRRTGRRGLAGVSVVVASIVASSLAVSVVASDGTGLAQRVGLTVGDLWIVASAVAAMRWRNPH